MNPAIDILRTELERLFSLDELTSMSGNILGLDPGEVGGMTAKATFAHALAARCLDADRIDALVDVILACGQGVDPRVREAAGLFGEEEVPLWPVLGLFTSMRKLGEGELSVIYTARRGDEDRVVKVLRREASRDKRAVQRFLAATRLAANVAHPGLPQGVEAGETDGRYWVSHLRVDAQPLGARFARTGPSHINEAGPLLRGILEPLAALHKARLTHGGLKMDNVLVGRVVEGAPHVTLVDFGTDRLRLRHAANGHWGALAIFGSPKTIAPEQVLGQPADATTDVYAFGALMYELLSGKPVFPYETSTDAALAHVAKTPEPPSVKAPRGWISKEVDQFVLSLLAKEPQKRPRDALAVLDGLEMVTRTSAAMRTADFPEDRLAELLEAIMARPTDAEAAIGLQSSIDEGADPRKVAEAFEAAASAVDAGAEGEDAAAKKALLYRAARIFDVTLRDRERAEKVYAAIVALDSADDVAQSALEDVRKALGKYAEIVESLMARSEAAAPGQERARIFAEIGRICATDLDDPEQGILAYAQSLCESPSTGEYAEEIERLAGAKVKLWNEVLSTFTGAIQGGKLGSSEQNALLLRAGRWYEEKLGRADLATFAFQQVLTTDPASEAAHEGLTNIYRRAQQWAELASARLARAAGSGR